jgi:hypothetical protein
MNNATSRDFYCTEIAGYVDFTVEQFMDQARTGQTDSVFALIKASDCTEQILALRNGFGFVVTEEIIECNFMMQSTLSIFVYLI